MKKFAIILCCLFICASAAMAQDSIQSRIVLIGDAGQLTNGKHPVVNAVKRLIKLDEKTTIIFLGDNLYKSGLPDNTLPTYDIAKAPLDSQIQIAGTSKAKVYFVPGNHDWANGGANGYESILRVQSYIDYLGNHNVTMYPRDGCPGPVEIKITDDIILVIMDSQWWLHEKDKPGVESDCPYKTNAEILTQLDDILSKNSNKMILLAMHHPFRSYSPHGGYFTFKQHIFPFTDAIDNLYIPLPVLGSVYPLTRGVFGTEQDLKHPLYQTMITEIEKVVKGNKNVVFVAGHDHSLQIIRDSGYNYIVSGSGSKHTRVSKSKNTLYAIAKTGFITLDVSKNKNVVAKVYVVNGDSVKMDYTNDTILNFSKIKLPKSKDTTRQIEYKFKDSVVISASDRYKANTGFRKTFLGNNYRKEWSTAIAMKEFNIRKEQGGLTIKSLGGGQQTKSLQLLDKNGIEWTLRSVDKDPEKAMPANLRGGIAQNIVQDMISASNPYAPLVVAELAKAADIITPEPELFFVPDDYAFGQYRELFANTVVMLENRNPEKNAEDAKSTNKIINKMLEDNDHHVDQEKVLTARLLDILIADFDRHAAQWKWGTGDTGKGKLYYPIPRDRDQAFFNSDGLLVKYLSRKQMPFLGGFKSRIKNINYFNYNARDFDRTFLNNLDEAKWIEITNIFQQNISDEVIHNAVKKFPKEIAALDSQIIANKLISRRNDLLKQVLQYYAFISSTVSVTGSNKSEYFHIKKNDLGLQLTVYKKLEDTDSASIMYNRIFDDKITKEIRLYGLNGDDKFEIDEDVSSKIKIRIIGGIGSDSFNLKGNVRNFIYDLSSEKNVILNMRRTKQEFSTNYKVNEYKSTGFQYNKKSFPQINVGYNVEDKVLVGIGFSRRTFGFRKDPYATDQKLVTLYAPSEGAYKLKYEAAFTKLVFNKDLVIHSEYVNPTLNNFFGFGNESVYDKTNDIAFYKVRYKFVETDLLFRERFNDIIQLSIGPTYFHYWSRYKDNDKRILGKPTIIGTDSLGIYGKKQFFGGKLKLDISYLNSETFPTRGITWFTEFSSLRGFNSITHALTKLTSDMTIYASISDKSRVSAVLHLGGGHIFSKQFEYFQALNLGANNFLRGYRKNRFSGSSIAYASTDLRLKLFKSQSYVLPGDVGLVGFYELGKVWQRGEISKKWHTDFGGGIYYVPYNLIMLSLTVAKSPEDNLFNFTLGTKFKLIF